MKDLFETLSAMTHRHSDLLQAGLSPEEATRIAFNPENESVLQVEQDMFNTAIRMAFLSGQIYQTNLDAGQALESQYEAINRCTKEITLMVS